jgi:hypothetical protein
VLDLQLPGGLPHVVLLSLLLLLVNLRDQAIALLTPADNGGAKVLLRLPAAVRDCAVCSCSCWQQLDLWATNACCTLHARTTVKAGS